MRYSTIFKSRWMALLWSAGILWFAMDVAGGGKKDSADNIASAANVDDAASDAALNETQRLVEQLDR